MAQVHAIPSLWLRGFSAFTRAALWLLLAAWITLGLAWGALHFLIVPRIGEFRPWLEQQASQRLGLTVRMRDIVARSNGLIPSVELRDVQLIDAQGREALRLPSVLAALSPRSAIGLGFEQLYIEGPELSVRRSADGRLWMAGFALPAGSQDSGPASDWVFSQKELVVRHGIVRWTDELRQQPTLALGDVDVVLRNKRHVHSLRVDADPPAGWGSRLSVRARFQQPLFFGRNGDWRSWVGQVYAQATQVDLAQLGNYVDLGVDLRQGAGSARAWVDIDRATVTGATADLALQAVAAKVAPDLDVLELQRVSGRVAAKVLAGGFELSTQALSFDTRDGLHWPGGNTQLRVLQAQGKQPAQGSLRADRLDLAALSQIASRLPLASPVRETLQRLAPQGLVETLQWDWQGDMAAPSGFTAKGRVTQLALASQPQPSGLGIPGLRGAQVDFDLTQAGGRATLALRDGYMDFPGVFANPVVLLDSFSGELQWRLDAQRITVDASKLRFANADAEGEAQFKWNTAPVPRGGSADLRFPGVLDLQGRLARVNLAAVPRYLPLDINQDARDYLAQAMVAGEGSNASFRVKGDLQHFPFDTARQGEFRIAGDIQNASYAYAPAFVMPPGSAPWPMLTQVAGALLLERDNLQIKAAKGLLAPGSNLPFGKTQVTISKLYDAPVVAVSAEARGPLADALAVVGASPLGGWMENALAHSTASGVADYRLKLNIPLGVLDKSTAQGSIALAGNDFQLAPAVPRLSRIRGTVAFSDTGFAVTGLQAQALGGEVRLDGGMNFGAAVPARLSPGSLRLQGVATAEGLRQASELGLVARVAQFSTGAAPYTATVALRAGQPELLVNSNLSGLALNLPEPFTKAAETTLPLRLESTVLRASQPGARLQDQWQVALGRLANVTFVRDIAGAAPKVLRGAIGVGLDGEAHAPLPASGVHANVQVNHVDVDAWTAVAARMVGLPAGGSLASLGDSPDSGYLPNSLALRARELAVEGRTFNQVLLGGTRDGSVWRTNVQATELNGYLEYRESSGPMPGRLFARLSHLTLGSAVEQDVENLLDQQPASIPALDIVVDALELRGKKLGRVDIQAVNQGAGAGAAAARDAVREWRLNRFNITLPEATLTATGNWVNVNAQATPAPRSVRERRRTVLNFKLDVGDSGDLLKRFGMPGVIAKGKGQVQGQVSWLGSPFSPDYPSMGGGFNINIESGQFLKADPGIAKLLGVLSLQSLPRRLALDFRDVFSDGFSFDYVRGDATITQGIARTSNLQMKGVNAAVMMEGQADIAKETQQIKVVVVPEINVASASLLYSAVNPVVGLTTFLANLLLRGPLVNANTQEFLIDGSWVDPRVTPVARTPDPAPAVPAAPAPHQ